MKLFTPFTIPQKDNCDLCKIKTNKRKATENRFLNKLFKNICWDRFDFVFDWASSIEKSELLVYKNEMPKNVSDKEEKIKSSSVNFM